jgi:hypothetical protein
MKTFIKESFKQLTANRYLLVLLLALIILTIGFAIIIGLSIHPSELQLISHYTAFGPIHLYRDQWFYLFVFIVFGLMVCVLHIIISVKLLLIKGRTLAIMYAWFEMGIILLGWVTLYRY